MKSLKTTGRIVGVLFFIIMLLWGIGFATLNPIFNDAEYLTNIYPNKIKVTMGVLAELIETAAVLGLSFILFPILKKHNESLAITYVGFRIFECMMLIVAILSALTLITLSQQYIETGGSDISHFETTGIILKELRIKWSFYVLALFHPLAAMPLYYFFYKTKLVPRWISVWGFLAALWVMLDDVVFESFGLGFGRISGNPIAGIPMGLNEVVLGIWLIIKGFNDSDTDSEPVLEQGI